MAVAGWVRGFLVLLSLPFLVVGGIIGAGAVGVGVPLADVDPGAINMSGPVVEADGEPDRGLNETAIAVGVHQRVNEFRRANGAAPLRHDPALGTAATEHSDRMAARGELAHSDSFTCRPAGENIVYTYPTGDIQTDEGIVNLQNNESKIAADIVRSWRNSPEHRANMLAPRFDSEGIGIVVADGSDGRRVWATQRLCG